MQIGHLRREQEKNENRLEAYYKLNSDNIRKFISAIDTLCVGDITPTSIFKSFFYTQVNRKIIIMDWYT